MEIFTCLLLLVAFLQQGFTKFLDWECGFRYDSVTYKPRMVNGSNASMTSSPWMASIYTKDDYFICGGTLITNRLVLTAAHCFYRNRNLKVILGQYDLASQDGCYRTANGKRHCAPQVTLDVTKGIMHPRFNWRTNNNDIAILQLARRVDYTDNIRPICIVLDKSWRNYIDGMRNLTATGWGYTRPGGPVSAILQTLQIRRQDPDICMQFVGKTPLHNEFCMGNWRSGVCNGDSGGPVGKLISYGNRPRFIQVGIASLTNRRCELASIFTDVLSHVDWILGVEEQYGYGYTEPVRQRPPSRHYPYIQWPNSF